jgi:hypothetical protein
MGSVERENCAKRISTGDGGVVPNGLFDSPVFRQAIQFLISQYTLNRALDRHTCSGEHGLAMPYFGVNAYKPTGFPD